MGFWAGQQAPGIVPAQVLLRFQAQPAPDAKMYKNFQRLGGGRPALELVAGPRVGLNGWKPKATHRALAQPRGTGDVQNRFPKHSVQRNPHFL